MLTIKSAIRMLLKHPGFTAVAVATIAIGIGATTALFSVYDQLVLNPVTVPLPSSLIAISSRNSLNQVVPNLSWVRYEEIRRRSTSFASLGISAFGSFFAGIIATIGIALLGPRMGRRDRRLARGGDGLEDRALVRGVALHRRDEVRDEVVAAAQLDVDLPPRLLDEVALPDEAVVARHDAQCEERDDAEDDVQDGHVVASGSRAP